MKKLAMKKVAVNRFVIFWMCVLGAVCVSAAKRVITVEGDLKATELPLLGNGLMGFIPSEDGLGTQRTYSAGVHEPGNASSVSKIRPVMSPFALSTSFAGLKAERRTLDMDRAAFTTVLANNEVRIAATQRSLRGLPCVSMLEVEVEALADVDGEFVDRAAIASKDSIISSSKRVSNEGKYCKMMRRELRYGGGAEVVASTSAILCDEGSEAVSADTVKVALRKGKRTSFCIITSICSGADYSDPWQESERQVLFAVREGRDRLVARHEKLWDELWQSDVTIDGNEELQTAVTTALYHLYSSVRAGSRRSIAPVGQSGQGYNGHIFWDADTWMLPVIAVLHPELARSMVDFRVDGLPAARKRAQGMGYEGAMFPWEADPNGEESTPTYALTGSMEQHITACVANGAWLYFCATGDIDWLRDEGFPLMKECADFWLSRVERNDDGSYSIKNVVGADEYAIGVDDNAFTNGAAKAALTHTREAAERLGITPDSRWSEVADNLKFHYFDDGTMREHATYDGAQIKQSDVTLLGYPLGVITDAKELLKNINYYDSKLDLKHGPAMSHGVMAVTLARNGRPEEAAKALDRAYRPNVRGPFMVLAETATNNRTYFLTGAGAMLQGIIFGYAGLDITPSGLSQVKTSLPASVKKITVHTPRGTYTR